MRRETDKLAAIRAVRDKWAERRPLLYKPGSNVMGDKKLLAVIQTIYSIP